MTYPRRRGLLKLAGAMLLLVGSAVNAADFPSKPIRLIAPFAAGGSTDLLARIIAPEMARRLGQNVIVENKLGAGGSIGLGEVAKADPDGHVLGVASPGPMVVNVTLMDNFPYDPVNDLAAVALIADLPILLVANPGVAANDMASLIALDKANPGKLFFASPGTGTTMHLSGELLNVMAGTRLQHVPYKGGSLATTDILSGNVQLGFLDFPSAGPFIASGKMKALAVGNKRRALSAPNLPTIAESGVPGYETSGWFGIVAPGKTPPEVVRRINAVLGEVMAMPDVRSRLNQIGVEPTMTSPAEFSQFIKSEIPKWARVIQVSGSKTKR